MYVFPMLIEDVLINLGVEASDQTIAVALDHLVKEGAAIDALWGVLEAEALERSATVLTVNSDFLDQREHVSRLPSIPAGLPSVFWLQPQGFLSGGYEVPTVLVAANESLTFKNLAHRIFKDHDINASLNTGDEQPVIFIGVFNHPASHMLMPMRLHAFVTATQAAMIQSSPTFVAANTASRLVNTPLFPELDDRSARLMFDICSIVFHSFAHMTNENIEPDRESFSKIIGMKEHKITQLSI